LEQEGKLKSLEKYRKKLKEDQKKEKET